MSEVFKIMIPMLQLNYL